MCHEATYHIKLTKMNSEWMCIQQIQRNSHAGKVRARAKKRLKSIALQECLVEPNMIPTLYYLRNMGADTIVS